MTIGRPRVYQTNAERQQAYRQRARAKRLVEYAGDGRLEVWCGNFHETPDWRQGPFRGELKHLNGTLVWACDHRHPTREDAWACAEEFRNRWALGDAPVTKGGGVGGVS